jgi:hypothetical protein
MRTPAIAFLILALSAASASAGQDESAPSASVLVEAVPGGGTAMFNSPTEAQRACTGAGGNFGLRDRRFVCVNPRAPLRSTRTTAAPPAAPADPPGSDPSARGLEVESVTLRPGERASFALAEGFSHQLLRRVAPSAPGAISVSYELVGGASQVTATSATGYPLTFRILADPDGNGGFSPVGEVSLPGDGTPAVLSRPGALGTISVGNFVGRSPGSSRPNE